MAGTAERGTAALKAFRGILTELKKSDKSFSTKSPQYEYLKTEVRNHHTTQRVWSKAPNEVESVADMYAQYLSSTRRVLELQKEYGGGERTVEESANLVGLTLPKKHEQI
ncbi:hypothetical protein PRIPAC_81270 [Pristionchus pacificus]|uniref:Protein FMC1 homolog n=1 Tax=Pristionchus pacificus TaxID=54126 RepID=A0A454XLZ6_PRIPA|nr:hypothetical protein PRIPAC_81270 [Pristionchus pacificus]|eukprot:PDM64077.1 hypothetical protein PRIPAC_54321 [Pristionchus pacificus]